MKVLGFCSYPLEAAATRYRLVQFIAPLAEKGINLTVSPFLDGAGFSSFYQGGNKAGKVLQMVKPLAQRFIDSLSTRKYDVILVQREAMMFGPPMFEWLAKNVGQCPIVLDLDDATYVRYISPTYGHLGSALKFFGKTDSLIEWSDAVICGNRFIAEYVEKRGGKATVVPTVVDTDVFCPVSKDPSRKTTLGWIGTHSTFPFLERLFPVLRELARWYEFTLKIVGAGKEQIEIEGVMVENLKWNLKREVEDFQSLDIGLYPMEMSSSANKEWLLGKSGFKAVQYMSVGIPFVVTPLGVTAEMGVNNETHFSATTDDEWYEALEKLLQSPIERETMGRRGREYALENYTVQQQADKIAEILRRSHKN